MNQGEMWDEIDFENSQTIESRKTEVEAISPSQFLAILNQVLAYQVAPVTIVGEVASFKVNQGKWVFFDLKDEESSVACFMPVWELRVPLEDGMRIVVRAVPKVTKWGKFSLTIEQLQPVGEGSLKRAFLMLKKKLAAEGLFAEEKKRPIPRPVTRLGVISSTGAAGYADFIKILNARWGGMKVTVAHTQVQGLDAPDQIIRALKYFNERGEVEAIAILRGGGSADDLSAFNDEALVRAVAASKIPVVTGIGHEIDESLVDLAADLRASTPSNAAELLTPDRQAVMQQLEERTERLKMDLVERIEGKRRENREKIERVGQSLCLKYIEPTLRENRDKIRGVKELVIAQHIDPILSENQEQISQIEQKICSNLEKAQTDIKNKLQILEVLNPEKVLKQGYAILKGEAKIGDVVNITTFKEEIKAKVQEVKTRI